MEFKEVLGMRKSIRKFKPTPIPEETVREILTTAQLAPSAGNMQAYRVRILKSAEDKNRIKEATMAKQESITSAPVVFVICADREASSKRYEERGREFYSIQDATIFAAYVQLAIASLGLASVWVGAFTQEKVQEACSLPENISPIAIIPFGYPDSEPRPRERKNLNEIII